MKFFSEFGSCFGGTGATVTPAADSAATLPQKASAGNSHASSRGSGKLNSAAHWKPALSAILEDSAIADTAGSSRKIQRTIRSQKDKSRSSATARSPSHADNYGKDSMVMAMPAFSPTPFLF